EHVVQRRTAVSRVLLRQLFEPLPQRTVVAASSSIPGRRSTEVDEPARPPLTHATTPQVLYGPASLRGRYHFPETSSFNAALSSSASASRRFSFWFSARALVASLRPRHPYRRTSP